MFGISLSPAWGAVFAVVILGLLLAVTHAVNLNIG